MVKRLTSNSAAKGPQEWELKMRVIYKGRKWEVKDTRRSIQNGSREYLLRCGDDVVVASAGRCKLLLKISEGNEE